MMYRQPFKGKYPITQRYGEKITDPKGHTGIDYACPEGTEILASADGIVMKAGWDKTGYGNHVIILHETKHATLYAHLRTICVYANQKVKQGDVIGLSGYSGNVVPEGPEGAHLHFEYRTVWNNYMTHRDPMTLPLTSVDDTAASYQQPAARVPLKGADQLGDDVRIVAPLGAWGWSPDFTRRAVVYPQGTKLHFTGKTTERNGYTYCEVYPEPVKYWVAVHDGETQILDSE